jgi:integrase
MSSAGWMSRVEEYLSARRGLGFALEQPAFLPRDFPRYADAVGHQGPLTTELAVRWARASRSGSSAQAVRRLGAVRQFARYRALLDPATEVPPLGLLGPLPRRPQPHIYSDAELDALLDQASRLLPRRGLRPRTYVAFFSLLASTGLRLSEACRLAVEDVELTDGVLTVREGKFRKARLVPLHPSTTAPLARYAADRDACCERPVSFFRTERTPTLNKEAVEKTFGRIRQRLGWTAQGRARQPRIHEYADVIVMPMSLGRGCSERFLGLRGRHSQSAWRKVRSVSVGRLRPGLALGGLTRSIAFCLWVMSACR